MQSRKDKPTYKRLYELNKTKKDKEKDEANGISSIKEEVSKKPEPIKV